MQGTDAARRDLTERIKEIKEEKGVLIMAHNYQIPPIQDLADVVGDSLALAREAMDLEAEVVVFCGVAFMAEMVKILNPDKKVVHPEPDARCPMAGMVDLTLLERMKEEYPEASVVAYVNTTAETKAASDICCTSANAVKVVRFLREKRIIFVPDQNLGTFVQRMVPEKEIVLYPGYCHVHMDITVEDVIRLKREHPEAEVLAHPECRPEVLDMADYIYSTEGMLRHAKSSSSHEFIILTEKDLGYRIGKETGKKVYAPDAICPNMKKITLENLLKALETLEPEVDLPQEIMERAKKPIERMLEIGRGEIGGARPS